MSATSPHPVGHSPSPNLDPPRDHLQARGKGPYLSGTSSQGGSEASLLRVKNLPGYNTPVFKGKAEQHAKVQETVATKVSASISALSCQGKMTHPLLHLLLLQGFIPHQLVVNEVQWFYAHLGINGTYFRNEPVKIISDHIITLFGAKVLAYTKLDPSKFVIKLKNMEMAPHSFTPVLPV